MARYPLQADDLVGPATDQYRIDTVLGPGGFGITYLARSLRLDRDVAIKEYFPAEFAYRDGTATVRSSTSGSAEKDFFSTGKRYFVEEARVLGKFRHDNIVRVIGIIEQNNTAYMVLEFEEGLSFKNWLKQLGRPPTQAELDRILVPLLSALDTIHSNGIFHRDIAPDNIIVRPGVKPVLIDFGAARQFARENSHTLGAIIKQGYSPPEQYTLDTKLQGAWSDIYALAATMYFAIFGHAPDEASKRQLQDTTLPIEHYLAPERVRLYSPSFLAALNAALVLRPRDRVQDIDGFRELLGSGYDSEERISRPLTNPTGNPVGHGGPRRSEPRTRTPVSVPPANVASGPANSLAPGRPDRSVPLQARASSAGPASAAAALGAISAAMPEGVTRIAGYGAMVVAAAAALGFLQLGGSYHPWVAVPATVICLGLVFAALERGSALIRPDVADLVSTAQSVAIATALVLAIFWLPFSFYPLSTLLFLAAALYAVLPFGRWVPFTVLSISGLHFVLAMWMLLGKFEFAARADGALPNPYFWPLAATSLAFISLLSIASAIQMHRRLAISAT